MKKQTLKEIIAIIDSNGGFCNLNNWNTKQISEYIYSNFYCSHYTAKKVSQQL